MLYLMRCNPQSLHKSVALLQPTPLLFGFLLLITCTFTACKALAKNKDKTALTKQYFQGLNSLNTLSIKHLLGDSINSTEGLHTQTYSKTKYLELLKWDAVFKPNYKILAIREKDGVVETKLTKLDYRIGFLHEKPFKMIQRLEFKQNHITAIETQYVDFDNTVWEANKNVLLNFIEKKHPEWHDVLYDQTQSGAKKLLKAITLVQTEAKAKTE